MIQLDKDAAKEMVRTASKLYLNSQVDQEREHKNLKDKIRLAKFEGKLTQQEIADETVVNDGEHAFNLSRQRISQIINEES